MSEEASLNETSNVRPRKACTNCYERKTKCNFDPGVSICNPCRRNGFECVIPGGDVPKPRRSIRATVEDLETRVQVLEQQRSPLSPPPNHHNQPPGNPIYSLGRSENDFGTASSSDDVSVPVSRGATSPWSILLSGTNGRNPELQHFRTSTERSADKESSLTMSGNSVPYDILNEVPGLSQSKIQDYARDYARVAPYPIVHWNSLERTIESLTEQKQIMHIGEATCVWIYMAFGAAHLSEAKAETAANLESGLYFQKAWATLSQLLMDYDLWALKAVTLMVHYLQATAKPQACWALLGTALRLAVSLGFARGDSNLSIYSEIEQEEGRRAFWLCYIMEKSLCINLGHSSSFTVMPQISVPMPFVPDFVDSEDDIFGRNEHDATNFFCQMIDLTDFRDKMLTAFHSGDVVPNNSVQPLLSKMNANPRIGELGQQASTMTIRDCIHDLAYSNTLQVLLLTQRQAQGGTIPEEAVNAARQSLDLISESHRSGQLMCLWMWLYYAFTSAVTLFLHSIANPLDRETTLDLAAISDLETICAGLTDISEGAARCMEIAKAMGAAIRKIAKLEGRKRIREADKTDEGSVKVRRIEPDTVAPLTNLESEQDLWQISQTTSADAMLAGTPTNFAWNEWGDWLRDANFTD